MNSTPSSNHPKVFTVLKVLLISRKFWTLLIGLAVLVLAEFVPSFNLDQEALAGLFVVVASYMTGVAIDPGPGGWKGVVQSRKFWAAAVGLFLTLLNGFGVQLPAQLSPDFLVWACVALGAYISGVALERKYLVMVPGLMPGEPLPNRDE